MRFTLFLILTVLVSLGSSQKFCECQCGGVACQASTISNFAPCICNSFSYTAVGSLSFGAGVYVIDEASNTCTPTTTCCPYGVITADSARVSLTFAGDVCEEKTDLAVVRSLANGTVFGVGSVYGITYSVSRSVAQTLIVSGNNGAWSAVATLTTDPQYDPRLSCCSSILPPSGPTREFKVTSFYSTLSCNSTLVGMRVDKTPCYASEENACRRKSNDAAVFSVACADFVPTPPPSFRVSLREFESSSTCTGLPNSLEYYAPGACVTTDKFYGSADGSVIYTCESGDVRLQTYALGCSGASNIDSRFPSGACAVRQSDLSAFIFSCSASALRFCAGVVVSVALLFVTL